MKTKDLKTRRKEARWSQTELAMRSGVPFPIISLIEHPERMERYLKQIEQAFQKAGTEQQQLEPIAA